MSATFIDLRAEAAAAALHVEGLETLSSVERQSAIGTWRARMVNEYISARVFAALVPQLMKAGASSSRIMEVSEFIAEELRHGIQCASVVHALGGEAVADLPPLPDVPEHPDAPPVEALLRNVLSISCLSETVAVSLIGAELKKAGPPGLQSTLKAIFADEVGHARFGWALLEEMAPTLDDATRGRLDAYLIDAFRHLREYELAHLPPFAPPTDAVEAYGVCDGNAARALFADTVCEVIVPRLEALGFGAAAAWQASHN